MFKLQPDSPTPLVTQIVDGLRRQIADGSLRPDARVPSIRRSMTAGSNVTMSA